MQNLSFHYFRSRTTVLKFTLVLALLLSIGLSVFSEWHNPAHILQADQHCALCLSAHNLDHSLPVQIPQIAAEAVSFIPVKAESGHYLALFVRTAGNRDPPFII